MNKNIPAEKRDSTMEFFKDIITEEGPLVLPEDTFRIPRIDSMKEKNDTCYARVSFSFRSPLALLAAMSSLKIAMEKIKEENKPIIDKERKTEKTEKTDNSISLVMFNKTNKQQR